MFRRTYFYYSTHAYNELGRPRASTFSSSLLAMQLAAFRHAASVPPPSDKLIADVLKECRPHDSSKWASDLQLLDKARISTAVDWQQLPDSDKAALKAAGLPQAVVNSLNVAVGFGSKTLVSPATFDEAPYQHILRARMRSNVDDPNGTGITLLEKSTPWLGVAAADGDECANVLIVRKWHHAFWERHKDVLHKKGLLVAIIGTPGIGKTIALNFILWKLLTSPIDSKTGRPQAMGPRRYVVLILPKAKWVHVFDTKEKSMASADSVAGGIGAAIVRLVPTYATESIILHDLGKDDPATPDWLPTVLATSPKASKYNEFLKSSCIGAPKFYAPLYSDDEMELVATNVWRTQRADQEGTWQERAAKYGNVPRLVFEATAEKATAWTETAMTNIVAVSSNAAACTNFLNGDLQAGTSDTLLCYVPSPTYTRYENVVTRSPWVLQQLTAKRYDVVISAARDAILNTSDGVTFERAMLLLLVGDNGSLFTKDSITVQHAADGNGHVDLFDQSAPLLPLQHGCQVVNFPNRTNFLMGNTLYVPHSRTFPLVDAFVYVPAVGNQIAAQLICFQFTIAKDHKPTASTLKSFIEEFNKNSLFWTGKSLEKQLHATIVADGKKRLQLDRSAPVGSNGAARVDNLAITIVYVIRPGKFAHTDLPPASGPWENDVWSRIRRVTCTIGGPKNPNA